MSYPTYDLTFKQFSELSRDRCKVAFHRELNDWSPEQWATAISGETGEMCNFVKKVFRGDIPIDQARPELLKELADIISYCDLMIQSLGAETDRVLMAKFDEVSKRVNYDRGGRCLIVNLTARKPPDTSKQTVG